MKRTQPQAISEIVEEVFRQNGMAQAVAEQRICYLWPEIVGPGINRYTTRRYVDRGTLHVYLSSSSLKDDLSYMRQSLIDQLNRAAGTNVITSIAIH
ncbi:MAG: DUF721 domain-containing protein [Muribaculaceae bacterium]|nr:DUF721 domain-containing protein [Muribaculaceae bacterium]